MGKPLGSARTGSRARHQVQRGKPGQARQAQRETLSFSSASDEQAGEVWDVLSQASVPDQKGTNKCHELQVERRVTKVGTGTWGRSFRCDVCCVRRDDASRAVCTEIMNKAKIAFVSPSRLVFLRDLGAFLLRVDDSSREYWRLSPSHVLYHVDKSGPFFRGCGGAGV